jgi:hypothetical protein
MLLGWPGILKEVRMTVRRGWKKKAAKVRKPRGIRSIAFVDMGDWQGLYINGVLKLEDTHIGVDEALRVLRIACRIPSVRNDRATEERLRSFSGGLPKRYKDVPGAVAEEAAAVR